MHAIDVGEVAHYTGLSRSTLNKLRVYGGGPTYHKLGSRVIYDRDDVDVWLTARRRVATAYLTTPPSIGQTAPNGTRVH